ncbi:hypothetical protein J27TS8_33130 [Robertmurraya siralis]|uniref:Uncharacterized protein n=1 Tax=Robertmurraya siralis TaxID=77777 RepID=A0A920BUJ7_9BACI|nr:hypothetical protein [Robertmurraya siralis]PAE18817.1 hypothetical protein CHH80_19420 [Bacillus sp. 7504-2]GIN63320.1 hypothetical protein J27TS8_33130 [Robertmurraya siralis]
MQVEFFNSFNSAQEFVKYDDAEETTHRKVVALIVSSNAGKTQYLTDEYFRNCSNPNYDHEVHINSDSIIVGQYYHLSCLKCQYSWDTGEHISISMDY